jgi:hypothetical protein
MSRRNPRQALLQDELLNAVQIGIALDRNNMARQQNDMARQQMVASQIRDNSRDSALMVLPVMVSAFDPDTENAPETFAEMESAAYMLSPQEKASVLEPAMRALDERRKLESEARNFGVTPVFQQGEDGTKRLDRMGTRKAVSVAQQQFAIEEMTFVPEVRQLGERMKAAGTMQDNFVMHNWLKEQDELHKGIRMAAESNLITPAELSSLFKPWGDGGTPATSDGANIPGNRIVDADMYAAVVAPRLRRMQEVAQTRENSAALAEALSSNVSDQTKGLGVLQAVLQRVDSGDLQMDKGDEAALKDMYMALAQQNMATIGQAGAARVEATPGALPDDAVLSRAGSMNPAAADSAARGAPVPLSKASQNFPAGLAHLAPGQTYTAPDGRVYQITE